MSWKGRHHRNWIRPGIGSWCDEFEITHEEKSETYGVFGVFEYCEDEWMVFWRPNRNCTTDWKIKVMIEKIEVSYSNYPREEEIKYPSEADAIAAIAQWQENFKHPEKPKRYRPRDSQKTKLYRWEHIMALRIGPTKLDGHRNIIDLLHQKHDHLYLRMFLNAVCNELDEKKVDLTFRSGGRSSTGGLRGIRLLPCHCIHLVMLHELAHVVHGRWGNKTDGNKHQAHGREFVGIFMYLLIRFGGVDKSDIIKHANDHKIDFLLPDKFWEWENSETQEKVA